MLNTFSYNDKRTEVRLSSLQKIHQSILKEFPNYKFTMKNENDKNIFNYSFELKPAVCFVLKAFIDTYKDYINCDDNMYEEIKEKAELITKPRIYNFQSTHVGIDYPGIPYYQKVIDSLGAYERSYGFSTVPLSRAFAVFRVIKSSKSFLPNFTVEDSIKELLFRPIENFDGTLSSLESASIEDIKAIKHAYQAGPDNFRNVGFRTPIDLLMNAPRRYIDKTQAEEIHDLFKGEEITTIGTIIAKEIIFYKHTCFTILVNNDEQIKVTFWQRAWMAEKYELGTEVLLTAKYDKTINQIRNFGGISLDNILEAKSLPIVPIYSQSEKNNIKTKTILYVIEEMLSRLYPFENKIANYVDKNITNMKLLEAISELHLPSSIDNYKKSINVLALYELIYQQLLILDRKEHEVKAKGVSKKEEKYGLVNEVINNLPYQLTNSQNKAIKRFKELLESEEAESAILLADVGAGKSLTTQLTSLYVVDAGYQVAMAGPTEVLAKQLYDTFCKILERIDSNHRPTIVFLSGGTKAKERRVLEAGIASGEIDIIVGTHSVLQPTVPYRNLGLVVCDEIQKYGTAQQEVLQKINIGSAPDFIGQTATPIPRSTARIFYGDIDVITLDEKPAGRIDIETYWIKEKPNDVICNKNHTIWEDIKNEIKNGHQAFVVVPMVFENVKIDAASVEETYKELSKVFKNYKIGYVHGQMKKELQNETILKLRNKEIDLLIASTVIEVGVDVPNATRMVVLSADRLGASTLHQIRGRVGRSNLQSKCYLVSNSQTPSSQYRLNALEKTNDGFKIATADLHNRGEGNLFGVRQSGASQMRFATLTDHSTMIDIASEEAQRIYNSKYKKQAIKDAKSMLKREE